MVDEPRYGGLIDYHTFVIPVLISAVLISFIVIAAYPLGSTGEVYLGYYPDDNITVGSEAWTRWHDDKLKGTECEDKEVLNTIDVCGGHVTVFCKKRLSWAYNWCEVHCMTNDCYWVWNIW